MGYNWQKIKMKKFFIMLFAALSFSIAVNAKIVPAFSSAFASIQVDVKDGWVYKNGEVISKSYSNNPYYNDKMCAPDWGWATCYKYCFSYNGSTFFFNLD